MQDELLDRAGRLAADELKDTGLAWVTGVGHLVNAADAPGAQPGDVERLLEDARHLLTFPFGRAAYLPGGAEIIVEPNYQAARLRSAPDVEPPFHGLVGVGAEGFVAVAGSSGTPGSPAAGKVLLPDIEASLVDTLGLAFIRAIHLGYSGPIQVRVAVVDATPARDACLWIVDEDTGEQAATEIAASRMEPIVVGVDMDTPHEVTHARLYEVVRGLCESLGLDEPQFIPPPGTAWAQAEMELRFRRMQERGLGTLGH